MQHKKAPVLLNWLISHVFTPMVVPNTRPRFEDLGVGFFSKMRHPAQEYVSFSFFPQIILNIIIVGGACPA